MFPLQSCIKEMLHFWSLLCYVSRSPQYRSSFFRFPSQIHCEEWDAPFPEPSVTCLRVSRKGAAPPGSLYEAPTWREILDLQSLLLCSFQKGALLPGSSFRAPIERYFHFQFLLLLVSHKDPSKWTFPSRFPNRTPVERCLFPEPTLHCIKKICFIL